ncbi:MAG TPA: hypothetical protein VFS49_05945 [Croceibacterium sp.]|nr:hypothetical protein [Croceibacterium sp.]
MAFAARPRYGGHMKSGALCLILAISSSTALAGAPATVALHPYEACLTTKALALERSGAEVSEIIAAAERTCRYAKGDLADAAAGEIVAKARLSVMQQRSDALNTRRRG